MADDTPGHEPTPPAEWENSLDVLDHFTILEKKESSKHFQCKRCQKSWWQAYGLGPKGEHVHLRTVAIAVLAQPTSACSCERAWSAYDFIHSRRRNRLQPARAEKLVYCFTNMRLVTKMQCEEEFHGWDEEEEDEAL